MNLHALAGPIVGAVNPQAPIGVQVNVGNVVAADGTQTPSYATPGSITASIGGTFAASASGTTLSVSAVLSGTLQVGDAVSGADSVGNSLASGTTVLAQLSGTPNGSGTYQISAPATVGPCTVTSLSTVLNVTGVASGVLQVGQTLADAGALAPGTIITGVGTGAGGSGTYSVNRPQTVASEAMTTSVSLLAQVQAQGSTDLRHTDMINLQGTHRVAYVSSPLRGAVRPQVKGGDLVTLPDGSAWLVTQVLEPWSSAGWTKVLITLQTDAALGQGAQP